jgi:hypothetical protein
MLHRQSRRQHDENLLQQLATSGASPLSLTGADRRSVKTNQGTDVWYNVQLAVGDHHTLSVAPEVTTAVTDQAQLATMASRAKDTLETEHLEGIADRGDCGGDAVKECLDEGIAPDSPTPNTSAKGTLGLFGRDEFAYRAQKGGDHGPAGQAVTFRCETVEPGRHRRY